MKIIEANAGNLTNFEVLDFLRSRGATKLGSAAPSECKVFDYLEQTAAANQSRESIAEFLKRSEKYDLTKAEKLQTINLRPTTPVAVYVIIEECGQRFDDEQVSEFAEMVEEVLPGPPANSGAMEVDQPSQ
ncbi:DNA-directed RNA polymerase III subunit RPC9 [Amborella trichopoda]|uniref:DNA-directed RNA polymerase III subunit RPC9 n=1 Tax=Amborella trichopoda TaxID=13333 RepID=UPI0005D400A9|nr:DNA-directed RNA polymerase III subunit RPC9 [Amborella trichopoda]XP_020529061.1 DNA-directed RNA polymerase III subunit RPC9 [Amborella trichopoda]XP_020529062.1 DNA-directed RNA polymerase III subunit RPC9 [Amborella trichopoda]|eukprot:XP_011626983.1 DNA-directed RNA polymerase III subunit RPC9 [Amborella trichopoda]